MKLKIGLIILVAACVGLGVALVAIKKQAEDQHTTDTSTIVQFSNELSVANMNLNDSKQVNLVLSNQLSAAQQESSQLSNSLTSTSGELATTKTALQAAEDKLASLNAKLADLENQNKTLDDRAMSMSNTIAALDMQIADTQHKLSNAETNNAFLLAELKEQVAKRNELERKFNDLNTVRTQVKKLRDDAFVERRLELMRFSATEQKGASLLQHPIAATNVPPGAAQPKRTPHYDLNVEVGSDGSVRVIPPPGAPTNSP